jgi:hypothetical protein
VEEASRCEGGKMFNKFFKKTEWVPIKDFAAKRDIAVRIVCPSPKPNASPFCEVEIAKDYEKEARISKPLNLVQCLIVGAAIGFLFCAVASIIGLKLSVGDLAAMIGVPAFVGLMAGYLIF